MSETVEVKGESPVIQATTGERSFTVTTDTGREPPDSNRSFIAAGVARARRRRQQPASAAAARNNIMMDGVSTMDTGSNSVLLQMNVESIAEVKVLVSNYQAEYGRSSGLQITAVTKSGTNRFRGSVYDVERNSDWNSNSKVNKLNGDPEDSARRNATSGIRLADPSASRAAATRCSSSTAMSLRRAPAATTCSVTGSRRRSSARATSRRRPTTTAIRSVHSRSASRPATCSATNTTGCFADGGVLGRIPKDRLYQTGLNVLNMFPMPTMSNVPAGQAYNYEITRPTENLLAWQPAIRLDYNVMSSLRATFKYSGWQQKKSTINGSIPGFQRHPDADPVVSTWTATANYNLTPTMFLEATYGQSKNELAGCGLAQGGTGPSFCQNAFPMNPVANRVTAGLGGLPYLFPDAVEDSRSSYYAYEVLQGVAHADLAERPHRHAAELPVGKPHHEHAAEHSISRVPQHQRDQGHRDQPDQDRRPAHDQDGLLQHPQLQGAAARRLERHHQLRQRHQQPASIRSSATRTRRSASSARTTRPRATSRARSCTTTPRASSRTTGRSTRS